MRPFVFIYARSDSSRLPNKPMIKLGGLRLIDIVIERALRVTSDCVLLTSNREVDDLLVEHFNKRGLKVVRGHSTNLVKRTLTALEETQATHFLRLNGDSPLFEPELAYHISDKLEHNNLISNLICRTFPYGVALEWIEAEFYKSMASLAEKSEQEHVTQHIYRNIFGFNFLSLTQSRDDSFLKLALDTPSDYERLQSLFKNHDVVSTPYWEIFNLTKPSLKVK
ncbi:cytidylyltransferase domain-containing protein [Halomonas sp. G11]|uniref:cytidylyltransferase domain-containing protein n=1 Tax=Halomonas sp. G11 TaxID=1684425 RepID=UPI000AAEFB88|nr:NTP transferase domain-containing protein [Halomonas sp. G11]